MPAKGTGGKHLLPKVKKKKKVYPKRSGTREGPGTVKSKKKYAESSMFAKAADNRDKAKTSVGKARPFGSAFKSAKDSGKKTFSWKGKSYTTKTKSELESGKSEASKFAAKGKANKIDSADKGDRFSRAKTKFGQSKTLAEFFGKLKKKK
tara:strand:- start:52 stop:501 length:450 start_codon:yes stop_codon:yes gene_type:complete